jgi:hypothetical protein
MHNLALPAAQSAYTLLCLSWSWGAILDPVIPFEDSKSQHTIFLPTFLAEIDSLESFIVNFCVFRRPGGLLYEGFVSAVWQFGWIMWPHLVIHPDDHTPTHDSPRQPAESAHDSNFCERGTENR